MRVYGRGWGSRSDGFHAGTPSPLTLRQASSRVTCLAARLPARTQDTNDYNGFTATQRTRALRWLKLEYAAGRRHPPTTCDGCGQTEGIIEAHSEDYSQPFGDHIGQYGFCFRCHMFLHCRQRSPEAWERYKAEIAAGVTFKPFLARNWYGFRAQHLMRWAPELGPSGPARPDTLSHIIG